jgi:hypothetical protein
VSETTGVSLFSHIQSTESPQARSQPRPRHLRGPFLSYRHRRNSRERRATLHLGYPHTHQFALYSSSWIMERPHRPARTVSELSPPLLGPLKQAAPAGRPHPPVVLHGLPAPRPTTSRGSSASHTPRPMTASTSRLPHQRHGHHSSDQFVNQHQYARPTAQGPPNGVAYTHHVTSRAEPVPIGNRDIIVGPAGDRPSSSPTTGTASKLFWSMKRTLSLKKTQPVRLLSLESIPRA